MLKKRSHVKEAMDDLDLNGKPLFQTLNGLAMINNFFGNKRVTLQAFQQEVARNPENIKHIVDLGCGGGDNLRAIANWCEKQGHTIQLTGIDGNANTLNYAAQKNAGNTPIDFKQADILDPHFELAPCDVLISSHFMYHFTDDELVDFLKKAKPKIKKAIILSELHRSFLPFLLFKLFGGLMPFSKMVREDGLLAIQRSFKRKELVQILKKAEITNYSLQWKWAFRYLLVVRFD